MEEMNQVILDKLNSRVGEHDDLYFLGDMALRCNAALLNAWLNKVICKHIYVIWGNHDKVAWQVRRRFVWHKDMAHIRTVEGQSMTLNHFAMRVWNKSHYGAWHLYGHSHGSLLDDPNSRSIDVGVDTNDFYPYSFDEVSIRMATKTFKPIDHHRSEE